VAPGAQIPPSIDRVPCAGLGAWSKFGLKFAFLKSLFKLSLN
jgi:hypothetical protein